MIYMTTEHWTIRDGTIEEAVGLSMELPEFHDPHSTDVYHARLSSVHHLILVATSPDGKLMGFKVGYERNRNSSFYSWMGGVLPAYRSLGIARSLAEVQHKWAAGMGYSMVRFKTMNKHKAMLQFALRHGFYIFQVDPRENPQESRIWLQKDLIPIP